MASLFRRVTRRLFGSVTPNWGAHSGGGTPTVGTTSMDFSDAANSQYLILLEDI